MANAYRYVKACEERRIAFLQHIKSDPCVDCGVVLEPERMHFHHRDPSTKSFTIAKRARRISRSRLLAEVAKCDLLCADCHARRHPTGGVPCPSPAAYNRGCRCAECRAAHAAARAKRRGRARRPGPTS